MISTRDFYIQYRNPCLNPGGCYFHNFIFWLTLWMIVSIPEMWNTVEFYSCNSIAWHVYFIYQINIYIYRKIITELTPTPCQYLLDTFKKINRIRFIVLFGFIRRLTHWGRVTHICVSNLPIIGSDNGLAPSHHLNQRWTIVDWALRTKLQWNFNRNSNIPIQENAFESVVWKMAATLSRPLWVNIK